MKKLIANILVVTTICTLDYPAVVHAKTDIYPLCGIVTEIEYEVIPGNDLVIFTCANGNEFGFYAPISDGWEIYDLAACIMDSNGTDLVYDDEVIAAEYAGGTEQLEEYQRSEVNHETEMGNNSRL